MNKRKYPRTPRLLFLRENKADRLGQNRELSRDDQYFQRGIRQRINSPRVGALKATLVEDGNLQQPLESARMSPLRDEESIDERHCERCKRFQRSGCAQPTPERYRSRRKNYISDFGIPLHACDSNLVDCPETRNPLADVHVQVGREGMHKVRSFRVGSGNTLYHTSSPC